MNGQWQTQRPEWAGDSLTVWAYVMFVGGEVPYIVSPSWQSVLCQGLTVPNAAILKWWSEPVKVPAAPEEES